MSAGPPALPTIDRDTVDAVLNALQAAASGLSVPAPPEALGSLLTGLGLLGPDGIQSCVDAPTLEALLAALAAWRPDVAGLLAPEAMTGLAGLPPGHAAALHAWPQGGFWRLGRARAAATPAVWCWWWQGQVWQAPASAFTDVGLAMQECATHHASRLRDSMPTEQAQRDGLCRALRQGIALAALRATEAHVRARRMFHRQMIELPAIARRVQQASALLTRGEHAALRIELEQLQGGFGFMQESPGAQWLDWLQWAESLPPSSHSGPNKENWYICSHPAQT